MVIGSLFIFLRFLVQKRFQTEKDVQKPEKEGEETKTIFVRIKT